jgi:hypothetical protein
LERYELPGGRIATVEGGQGVERGIVVREVLRIGPGLCRMLDMNFAEHLFPDVG